MAASLFQHGAIRTTETKAKELRGYVEKLITTAKKGTLTARREVLKELRNRELFVFDETEGDYVPDEKTIVQKLFEDIAPRYADRPGGYTRIIRLADRRIGDAGVQVVLQLVEEDAQGEGGGSGRRKRRAQKRHEAAKNARTASSTASAEVPAEESVGAELAEEPQIDSADEAQAHENEKTE
jgi:large subunit ribosomal protein L17